MHTWIVRAAARWKAAGDRGREAAKLALLPDHLLYDMGLSRDNLPSLARQLRVDGER
jgi:uncharacterized protein YjiS (DUF1127 family)